MGAARGEDVSRQCRWICKGQEVDSHSGSFQERFKGQRGEVYTRQTLWAAPKQTIKLLSPATKTAKFCFTLLWVFLFVSMCWGCALLVDQCLYFIRSRLIYRVHGKPVLWFIQYVTRLKGKTAINPAVVGKTLTKINDFLSSTPDNSRKNTRRRPEQPCYKITYTYTFSLRNV